MTNITIHVRDVSVARARNLGSCGMAPNGFVAGPLRREST